MRDDDASLRHTHAIGDLPPMYPRILYPLLPYRSFLAPILTLWAVIVPCWLVLRLYLRRSPAHRVSLGRELLLLVFVAYVGVLGAATLSPSHSARYDADTSVGLDLQPSLRSLTCSTPNLARASTARGFCIRNAGGNVALFFPLGFLIPFVWPRLGFWRALEISISVSVGIELVQYFSHSWMHRSADVNDVILNTVGATIGLVLAYALRAMRGERVVASSPT